MIYASVHVTDSNGNHVHGEWPVGDKLDCHHDALNVALGLYETLAGKCSDGCPRPESVEIKTTFKEK